MMTHSSAALWFAVACCCVVLQVVSAQDTIRDIQVLAFRKEFTPLLFKKLIPNAPPGMLVTIRSLPQHGTLYKPDRTRPIIEVGQNNDDNFFYYKSNDDFPANGVQRDYDTFNYSVSTQGTYQTGVVNITVALRGFEVRNYVLYAVNLRRPRNLVLNVRDSGVKLTRSDAVLGDVRIETLPTGNCQVLQYDGTAVTAPETVVTDTQLRVKFKPDPDMADGATCSFKYTALRRNGVRTRPATVTLIAASNGFVPRAYPTRTVYNVDSDPSRPVELIGSTRNPGTNLTFILTKAPSLGQLYSVAETSQDALPDYGVNSSTPMPLTLYSGPKTRVVLTFKLNPSDLAKSVKTKTVTAKYIVRDNKHDSAEAIIQIKLSHKQSPICGDTLVTPVFWDKPVTRITLNYTNPNERKLQKLILISRPANPIGRLLYSRTIGTAGNESKTEVRLKGYFSDLNNRLWYRVKKDRIRDSGNETYKYRAVTFDGQSCVGTITFQVMQHDAKVLPNRGNLRRELVRLRSVALLPLWGTANKTIVKPTSVVINNPPQLGTLFQVAENTPYERGRTYRMNRYGQGRTYCGRHDCPKYFAGRLDGGSTVRKSELFSATDLDSSTRFWVFYQAPDNAALTQVDTFDYYFYNDKGEKSELQTVTVNYRPPKKRIIECRYKANPDRNQNFDHQQETIVQCVLSNITSQRVLIPEFDKYRRHGAQVNFRLFQYRRDGNRVIAGARLANTTKDNIQGMWLDNENTVVVIPAARARQMNFQFRAFIYNTTESGTIVPATMEPVRVMVIRENTVPIWNYEYITNGGSVEATVGVMADIDISAFDADGDLLSFRLAEGVKRGMLFFDENRFGLVTSTLVKTGSVLRIPKGSYNRNDIRMHYKTDGAPGWTFPKFDNFTLYADDGGGVLSLPLTINITIVGDATIRKSAVANITVSYATLIVALMCCVAILILILAAVLRRRGRQRYMTVPQQESEMK